jgi:hypothetical protein
MIVDYDGCTWLEVEGGLVRLEDVRAIVAVSERSSRATEGSGTTIVMRDTSDMFVPDSLDKLRTQIDNPAGV